MLWEDQVSMYTWEGEEEEQVKLRQKQFSAAFEKDIQHPFLSHIQTHFHIEKEIKKKAKKLLDWWLSFSTTTMVVSSVVWLLILLFLAIFHGSPYYILRTNTSSHIHIHFLSVSHSQKSSLIFLVVFFMWKKEYKKRHKDACAFSRPLFFHLYTSGVNFRSCSHTLVRVHSVWWRCWVNSCVVTLCII